MLIDFVADGGNVVAVAETRQEKRDEGFSFYYKAILPVAALMHGLFVELILVDDDPNDPAVLIVSAHEQGS